MPEFGPASKSRLEGVHPDLVSILFEAVEIYDITIICGSRTIDEQRKLLADGKSKTLKSKHLIQDDGYCHAVDVAPYPVDWNDSKRFFFMAGIVIGIAKRKGIKLRWGHDWDMDMDFDDQTFNDSPHFEIITEDL